jgi:hypothetical protein
VAGSLFDVSAHPPPPIAAAMARSAGMVPRNTVFISFRPVP